MVERSPSTPQWGKTALELATATPTGDHQTHSDDRGNSPIYVFASDGRLDTDKAGNPAIVFDCIYHSLFKSVLKDADVKKLLIGVLEQRIISVPTALFPHDHHRQISPGNTSTRDLSRKFLATFLPIECPSWTWRKEGQDIFIMVQVPRLTHTTITSATLDIEPRRLTLVIPDLYELDINLDLSDSALVRTLRARNLNIDRARAEWRTKERCLVIVA
ncbi:hypothetical protein EI94DRAFT_1750854 [Lactarius quietus]|nr:hypothetical protein EI94DRAFT_1750854 [Lactarius quietus]